LKSRHPEKSSRSDHTFTESRQAAGSTFGKLYVIKARFSSD
jgi:hypothetical protein